MYKDNQKAKQDACLVCGEPLLKDISLIHLINNYSICHSCMKKFEILNWEFYFHHYHLTILFSYNDFFKSLLFQYKGQYDYLLKDVFVDYYKEEFKQRYKDYIIVPIPSSKEDNQIRGFAPMKEIALTFSDHIFLGLYKKQKYKQSDMAFHLRSQNNKLLSILQGGLLTNKKVLLFDDVFTSGNTIKTALNLIESYHPQSIEILILSTKRSKEEIDQFK